VGALAGGLFGWAFVGGVTVWAFRAADWLVGAVGLSVAELEALNWGWGWRVGGFALKGAAEKFDSDDERVVRNSFICMPILRDQK
jgi:hypothetical protein